MSILSNFPSQISEIDASEISYTPEDNLLCNSSNISVKHVLDRLVHSSNIFTKVRGASDSTYPFNGYGDDFMTQVGDYILNYYNGIKIYKISIDSSNNTYKGSLVFESAENAVADIICKGYVDHYDRIYVPFNYRKILRYQLGSWSILDLSSTISDNYPLSSIISKGGLLYLACYNKIYKSSDYGDTWTVVYTHPTNIAITDLYYYDYVPQWIAVSTDKIIYSSSDSFSDTFSEASLSGFSSYKRLIRPVSSGFTQIGLIDSSGKLASGYNASNLTRPSYQVGGYLGRIKGNVFRKDNMNNYITRHGIIQFNDRIGESIKFIDFSLYQIKGLIRINYSSQTTALLLVGYDDIYLLEGSINQLSITNAYPSLINGSYVGTGTYGSSNKNQLLLQVTGSSRLRFTPKIVIIRNSINPSKEAILLPECTSASSGGSSKLVVSTQDNFVFWYSDSSAADQLNESGVTYYYTAIY